MITALSLLLVVNLLTAVVFPSGAFSAVAYDGTSGETSAEDEMTYAEARAMANSLRAEEKKNNKKSEDLDYVLGRPMTDEEIAEQKSYVGQTSTIRPKNEEDYVIVSSIGEDTSENADNAYEGSIYGNVTNSVSLSSFDLRDYGRDNAIKDQGDFGTCWSYSAINSVESNLITNYSNLDETLDLSEKHLAYFTYNDKIDKLGNTAGDTITPTDNYLDLGGNQTIVANVLTNWNGVVYDTDMPIDSYDASERDSVYDATLSYSSDDYHVRNALHVSLEDTNYIKKMLTKYGAGVINYCWAGDEYMNYDTAAYYNWAYGPEYSNHAVTLVGWDDNYSKENFYDPFGNIQNDGAWLIKNSWSEYWGDEGYFWMSYEEASIIGLCYDHSTYDTCSALDADVYYDFVTFYTAEPVSTDSNLYTYDGGPVSDAIYGTGFDHMLEANVFTAAATESLNKVCVGVVTTNADYAIQVYTNLTDSSDPTSGTAAFDEPQRVTLVEDGYHTIDLDTPVALTKGQKFSVVVYSYSNYLTYDVSSDWGWVSFEVDNEAGQSFFSLDYGDNWIDLTEDGQSGNFRIRAITGPAPVAATSIKLDTTTKTMNVGESFNLICTLNSGATETVKWTSSNENVVTVSSNGLVTALSSGSAYVYADVGAGRASCAITVSNPATAVEIDDTESKLAVGDTVALTAKILPEDNTDKLSLSWSSSNTSVATVNDSTGVVTGVAAGTVTITAKAGSLTDSITLTVESLVKATGITLSDSEIEMVPGSAYTLTATVSPANATYSDVTWTSSNESVATVSADGNVVAKGIGSCTVTASNKEGVKASCTVKVVLWGDQEPIEIDHGYDQKLANGYDVWYKFTADADDYYTLFSDCFMTEYNSDPYITVYNANGIAIAYEDDYSTLDFMYEFSASEGDVFYFNICSYYAEENEVIPFMLMNYEEFETYTNVRYSDASEIFVGSKEVTLSASNPSVRFYFEPSESGLYSVEVTGETGEINYNAYVMDTYYWAYSEMFSTSDYSVTEMYQGWVYNIFLNTDYWLYNEFGADSETFTITISKIKTPVAIKHVGGDISVPAVNSVLWDMGSGVYFYEIDLTGEKFTLTFEDGSTVTDTVRKSGDLMFVGDYPIKAEVIEPYLDYTDATQFTYSYYYSFEDSANPENNTSYMSDYNEYYANPGVYATGIYVNGAYEAGMTADVELTAVDINDYCMAPDIPAQEYLGEPVEPYTPYICGVNSFNEYFTGTDSETGSEWSYHDRLIIYLWEDNAFTTSFANNNSEGLANVTYNGMGIFEGSIEDDFVIGAGIDAPVLEVGSGSFCCVTWDAVVGATHYDVYRYNEETGYWDFLDTIEESGEASYEYDDSQVELQGEYQYKVIARREYFDITVSDIVFVEFFTESNIVTIVCELSAPELEAHSVGYTSAKLTWTPVPFADGYEIYRCDRAGQPYNYITSVSGDVNTYTNIALSTGTTYYFKVRAYAEAGDGSKLYGEMSNYHTARPLPATPVLTAKRTSATTATISWVKIYGATGYSVYRSTEKDGTYTFVAGISDGSTTTYKATGLASTKTYYYKVRAYRAVGSDKMFGNYSLAATVPGAPAVPTITARSVGYTSARVEWTAVPNVSGYSIYRCDVGGGTYKYIASVGADTTTYTNTGLSTGTTYYYKVRAYVSAGSDKLFSNYSPCATARPLPATPVVKAEAASDTSITISWVKIYGATGYSVYRSTEKDGTYSFHAAISSGSTVSYTDKNLTTGQTYYYKVRAYRAVGSDKMFGNYSVPVGAIPEK